MVNESIFDVGKCIGAFATDYICLSALPVVYSGETV